MLGCGLKICYLYTFTLQNNANNLLQLRCILMFKDKTNKFNFSLLSIALITVIIKRKYTRQNVSNSPIKAESKVSDHAYFLQPVQTCLSYKIKLMFFNHKIVLLGIQPKMNQYYKTTHTLKYLSKPHQSFRNTSIEYNNTGNNVFFYFLLIKNK